MSVPVKVTPSSSHKRPRRLPGPAKGSWTCSPGGGSGVSTSRTSGEYWQGWGDGIFLCLAFRFGLDLPGPQEGGRTGEVRGVLPPAGQHGERVGELLWAVGDVEQLGYCAGGVMALH